jgi:hypothetical protein
MAKVARRVALRAEGRRSWRAMVALAVAGTLGAACTTGAAHRASSGPSARASSARSASQQQPGGTADCHSATTCYSPEQIEAAYGIVPLLHGGI